ncbi:hypothetical protein F4805DRAFT_171353 [Annulohypoxylon moriforme]|nr:hypothetical protein F4805DRAFT_171353 [Annulohypoxylon moriforme]
MCQPPIHRQLSTSEKEKTRPIYLELLARDINVKLRTRLDSSTSRPNTNPPVYLTKPPEDDLDSNIATHLLSIPSVQSSEDTSFTKSTISKILNSYSTIKTGAEISFTCRQCGYRPIGKPEDHKAYFLKHKSIHLNPWCSCEYCRKSQISYR